MTKLWEANRAIVEYFQTGWTAAAETLPLLLDGEVATLPASGSVLLRVRESLDRQETMGRVGLRQFERVGRILIEIRTPADGSGSAEPLRLAEVARGVLVGRSFGGVYTHDTTIRTLGIEDQWFRVDLDSIFHIYDRQ